MKERIYEAMENLQEVLKTEVPKDAVSCEVFINCDGYEWSIECRAAKTT